MILALLKQLVDDVSDIGCYWTDKDLTDMLTSLQSKAANAQLQSQPGAMLPAVAQLQVPLPASLLGLSGFATFLMISSPLCIGGDMCVMRGLSDRMCIGFFSCGLMCVVWGFDL